ncbi:MAG: hypothetical protein ABWY65_01530 [Thermoleophilaceae bacterium]
MAVASGTPIGRVESLVLAAPEQASRCVGTLVAGIGLTTALLALFGQQPGELLGSVLVGTAVFAAEGYLRDTAALVPRGAVQQAPVDVAVGTPRMTLLSGARVAGVLSLCVPAAWLMDRWSLSAAVLLGVPFGSAVASLIALVRIRRWERANGRRVLYDPEAEDVRPYAGSPL